jgi:hypothetical protein
MVPLSLLLQLPPKRFSDARVPKPFLSRILTRFFLSWVIAEPWNVPCTRAQMLPRALGP